LSAMKVLAPKLTREEASALLAFTERQWIPYDDRHLPLRQLIARVETWLRQPETS
jgi:hypothetical protein